MPPSTTPHGRQRSQTRSMRSEPKIETFTTDLDYGYRIRYVNGHPIDFVKIDVPFLKVWKEDPLD